MEMKLKEPKLAFRTGGGELQYDLLIEMDVPVLWA